MSFPALAKLIECHSAIGPASGIAAPSPVVEQARAELQKARELLRLADKESKVHGTSKEFDAAIAACLPPQGTGKG